MLWPSVSLTGHHFGRAVLAGIEAPKGCHLLPFAGESIARKVPLPTHRPTLQIYVSLR